MDQGFHDAPIEPRGLVFGVMAFRPAFGRGLVPDQVQRCPGSHAKGHQQRKHHGGRCAHRDGTHIGSHQAAHKGHRKDGGDHRQGRQNRGIAHLVHGLDGHAKFGPVAVFCEPEVPHNIFHHHDGVIHQDTDGKNQREKGDAIEGIAVQVKHRQRQGQGHRNGAGDHTRLPDTQGQQDQDGHGNNGDQHVPEKFVRFFLGGFAVMPGNGHMDVVRHDRTAGIVQAGQDPAGNGNGIGPFALGNGQGNGRIGPFGGRMRGKPLFTGSRPGTEKDVLIRFPGTVHNLGHIAQINGTAVMHIHHHVAHIGRILQESAGMHQNLTA